jgi:erythromycin esterase
MLFLPLPEFLRPFNHGLQRIIILRNAGRGSHMKQSVCSAFIVLAACAALATPAMGNPAEDAAVKWLMGSAHPISREAPAAGELDPLAAVLGQARVVGVGEATHGTHEDDAFKAELVKTLIRRGQIDTIAIEANRTPVAAVDAYIHDGSGDPVAALEGPGMFRLLQTEEFVGLVTWLRAWNRTAPHPVRVIGIDVQDSSADLDFALKFVEQDKTASAAASDLRVKLAPLVTADSKGVRLLDFVGHTTEEDWKRVYEASLALEKLLDTRAGAWAAHPDYAEARYAARAARQGLSTFEYDVRHIKPQDMPLDVLSRRDVYMADNLLDRIGANGRAVLWAHDVHVLRYMNAQTAAYTTVGKELSDKLGTAYAVVGFAWSDGSFNAQPAAAFGKSGVDLQPFSARDDAAEDIGAPLARVGLPRFWFAVSDLPSQGSVKEWLAKPYYRGWCGGGFDPKSWQNDPTDKAALKPGVDVLVYFHTISPTHLLPRPS